MTTFGLSSRCWAPLAVRHRVAHWEEVRAATRSKVVPHVAESVGRTWWVDGVVARVDTVLVNTSAVLRAVRVYPALYTGAAHQRVAFVSRQTLAGGAVVCTIALCVCYTRISQDTRVDTLSVVTHLVLTTLVV